MMRKSIYLAAAACMMVSLKANAQNQLSGELNGMDGVSLEIASRVISNDKGVKTDVDTVVVKNGKFIYNFKDNVIRQVAVSKVGADKKVRSVYFVKFPGKNVILKGCLYNNYSYDGDEIYKAQNELISSTLTEELKMDSISSLIKANYKGQITPQIEKWAGEADEYNAGIEKKAVAFIKKNIKTPVGLSLISIITPENAVSLMDEIPEEIRNGELNPMYQMIVKQKEKLAAGEKVKEGNIAPDFTLKDNNGKNFTLSSLKGKYVILDFWGSWCGWCIKGIPDMKETYKEMNGKIEIVSIACRDTKETWNRALKRHQLPWINVIDDEDKVSALYAISGFPTKLIINPKGEIEKTYVGETPEFYKYIKENIK